MIKYLTTTFFLNHEHPLTRINRPERPYFSIWTVLLCFFTAWLLNVSPLWAGPSGKQETPSRAGLHDPNFTLNMAFQHYYNGEFDKATQFFEKYIELAGPEEVAYRYLGQIYIFKKDLTRAREYLDKALQANPKSEASLSLLANTYTRQNQYDKAAPLYEKIVELDPLNENALYTLAQIYQMQNQSRKSIVYYRKLAVAVEKQSNNKFLLHKSYVNLASYYYNKQNYSKAMEYYEKIIEIKPKDTNSGYILAELYKINGRFEDSAKMMISILPRVNKEGRVAILESLIESLYILDDYRLKRYLNEYFSGKGNKNTLINAIRFEVENNPKAAQKYFKQTLKKNSSRLSAHIGLYRIYQKAGDSQKVQTEAYRIIIAAQEINALKISRAYLNKLYSSFDDENRESGFHETFFQTDQDYTEKEIDRHIDIAVKYVEMYNVHAATLDSQKRRLQAISYYSESLRYLNQSYLWLEKLAVPQSEKETQGDDKSKPKEEESAKSQNEQEFKEKQEKYDALKAFLDDRKYRTIIALVWLMNQEKDPAKAQMDALLAEAIELAPKEPQAPFIAGIINFSLGEKEPLRYQKAENHLTRAISMYEELASNQKAAPGYYYYLGVVKEKLDKFEETIVLLEQAIELDPFNPTYLNYLGYMYSLHNMELEKAYEYTKRALDDAPEEAMYLDTLGWIYFKMGKYEEALGQLLVANAYARKAKLKDPVIAYHLAETYFKLNNRHLALMYYKQAIKEIEFASEPLNTEYIKNQILLLEGDKKEAVKTEEPSQPKK